MENKSQSPGSSFFQNFQSFQSSQSSQGSSLGSQLASSSSNSSSITNKGISSTNDISEAFKTGLIRVPESTKKSSQKVGYLTKQGAKVKNWKKRYFLLKDNFLYYFKTPKDSCPNGVILLNDCIISEVSESDIKKKYAFSITARKSFTQKTSWKDRVYYFHADNSTDMESWMIILKKASPGKNLPHAPRSGEDIIEIQQACRNGDLTVFETLVSENKKYLTQQDHEGNFLIHWACVGGHLGIVEKLSNFYDVSFDVKNREGFLPLHAALQEDRIEVFTYMLDHGADISTVNEEDNGNTLIHYAAQWNAIQCIRLLVERGAQVNQQSQERDAPLLLAAERGNIKIAEFLLAHNASVNVKNHPKKGELTPFLLAIHNAHLEMAKLLLQNKSNINEKTTEQLSCLHLALRCGREHPELIQFLIENGADVNAATLYGDTPLHYAAFLGYAECAKILIKSGASLEAKGQNMSTPLHFAAREGQFEVVKLLVESGASLDCKDDDKDTPLNCAQMLDQNKCFEYLKFVSQHGHTSSSTSTT